MIEIDKKHYIIQRAHGFGVGGIYISKSPTLTANAWIYNNFIMENIKYISGTYRSHKVGGGFREIKSGKGACLLARARQDGSSQNVIKIIYPEGKIRIRRMTPAECAKLQTVPNWYKFVVSETQQYKLLGNGWTIDVIKHILSFLKNDINPTIR